jgi:hypothetical protein
MEMTAKRIVTACAMALAVGGMGAGGLMPDAAAAKDKAKKDDPSRRVCRNIVKAGTRLSTRVCRTQQQWDDAMDKTQDGVLQHQMGPGTTVEMDKPRA